MMFARHFQQAVLVQELLGIIAAAVGGQYQRYGALGGCVVQHILRQHFQPVLQVFILVGLDVAETVFNMLHYIQAVGGHAVDDGVTRIQRVGGLVPVVAGIQGGSGVQPGLHHRYAHRFNQDIVVYAAQQFRAQVCRRVHIHLLQGLCLVEVVIHISRETPIIGFVRVFVFFHHVVGSVHQVGGHKGGYGVNTIHGAAHQHHSGDTGDVVEVAGDVVVHERGAAADPDEVTVGQAAVVSVIRIPGAGVTVLHGIVHVAHSGLQLIISVLVGHAEARLGIGRSHQHGAAVGFVHQGGNTQALEVGKGLVLIGESLIGIYQQVRVHAGTGGQTGVRFRRPVNVCRVCRVGIQRGIRHIIPARGVAQKFTFISTRLFQRFKGRLIVQLRVIIQRQRAAAKQHAKHQSEA